MAKATVQAIQYEVTLKLNKYEWTTVLEALRTSDHATFSYNHTSHRSRYAVLLNDIEKAVDIP